MLANTAMHCPDQSASGQWSSLLHKYVVRFVHYHFLYMLSVAGRLLVCLLLVQVNDPRLKTETIHAHCVVDHHQQTFERSCYDVSNLH